MGRLVIVVSKRANREGRIAYGFIACTDLSSIVGQGRGAAKCVAAPDSLKNEHFCSDHNIVTNPAAKRPSATLCHHRL